MRECLDEGILQSYFDGELSNEHLERVASHLVSCMECASAVRELEVEAALLSNALAVEFDGAVPTERLRHRIDVAMAGLKLGNQNSVREPVAAGGRGWLQSLSALFAFTPQRTFGYAALAVVLAFATIVGVIKLRQEQSPTPNTVDEIAGGSKGVTTRPGMSEVPPVASPTEVVKVPENEVAKVPEKEIVHKSGVQL